jgi:hypothetical protein
MVRPAQIGFARLKGDIRLRPFDADASNFREPVDQFLFLGRGPSGSRL